MKGTLKTSNQVYTPGFLQKMNATEEQAKKWDIRNANAEKARGVVANFRLQGKTDGLTFMAYGGRLYDARYLSEESKLGFAANCGESRPSIAAYLAVISKDNSGETRLDLDMDETYESLFRKTDLPIPPPFSARAHKKSEAVSVCRTLNGSFFAIRG